MIICDIYLQIHFNPLPHYLLLPNISEGKNNFCSPNFCLVVIAGMDGLTEQNFAMEKNCKFAAFDVVAKFRFISSC